MRVYQWPLDSIRSRAEVPVLEGLTRFESKRASAGRVCATLARLTVLWKIAKKEALEVNMVS